MTRPKLRSMSIRPLPLAVILVAFVGFCLLLRNSWQEYSARERVSNTLAKSQEPLAKHQALTPDADLMLEPRELNIPPLPSLGIPDETDDMLDERFGFQAMFPGLPDNGIKVQETKKAYIIQVPLASEDDASHINLKVSRRHIEVSGQTGDASAHDLTPGVSVISSFMQSFDTAEDLDTEHIQRTTSRKEGQIIFKAIIPKKSESPALAPRRGFQQNLLPEPHHSRVF